MTNATLQTYKKIIGFPFAGADTGDGVYDIRQNGAYPTPASTVIAAGVSLAHGFDSSYDVPAINGGSILDTKVLNSVLSLISRDAAYRQAGGIYTFEQELSDIIGGYPEGAILQYIDDGGTLHYLRSLVDNNTSNFVRDGIDSTKWMYCLPAEVSRNLPLVDWGSQSAVRYELATINQYTKVSANTDTWYDIANGTFTSSGYINIINSSDPIIGPSDAEIPNGVRVTHSFCLCIGGNSGININNYTPDQIINNNVDGSAFQILLGRKLKTAETSRSWWFIDGMMPVNAGTSWAVKYKCTSSSSSFTGYSYSGALQGGAVKVLFQRLR